MEGPWSNSKCCKIWNAGMQIGVDSVMEKAKKYMLTNNENHQLQSYKLS